MNTDKQRVKEFLSQLSPRQMVELVEELRTDWALPELGTTVVDPNPKPPPDPGPSTHVDVLVTDVGSARIAVIRALRVARPDLDLRGARDLLRGLPATVANEVARDTEVPLVEALREAGATVEVRDHG